MWSRNTSSGSSEGTPLTDAGTSDAKMFRISRSSIVASVSVVGATALALGAVALTGPSSAEAAGSGTAQCTVDSHFSDLPGSANDTYTLVAGQGAIDGNDARLEQTPGTYKLPYANAFVRIVVVGGSEVANHQFDSADCSTSTPTTPPVTETTTATKPPVTNTTTATQPATKPTITSITAPNCTTGVGTITVSNPVAGATITLGNYYHVPGDSVFHQTSPFQTTTITLVAGKTVYSYSINVTSGYPANANTLRVQVVGTNGANFGSSVNTKSPSYGPCKATPTTPPVTETTTVPPTTTPPVTTTTTATTPPVTTTTTATTPPVTETTSTQPPTSTTPPVTETTVVPPPTHVEHCADDSVHWVDKNHNGVEDKGECVPNMTPPSTGHHNGGQSNHPGGNTSYYTPGGKFGGGAQAQAVSQPSSSSGVVLAVALLAVALMAYLLLIRPQLAASKATRIERRGGKYSR
jgi:hypothetical protein